MPIVEADEHWNDFFQAQDPGDVLPLDRRLPDRCSLDGHLIQGRRQPPVDPRGHYLRPSPDDRQVTISSQTIIHHVTEKGLNQSVEIGAQTCS